MYQRCLKRVLDITAVLLLCPFLIPVCAAVACLIWFDDNGPILFRQIRPGLGGKPFLMLKFRTMSLPDSNRRIENELQRITRTGRYLRKASLDELPELINILRGEMSFIGPRPLLCEYLEHYTPVEARRHLVRPGVTGWAQVNGRNHIPISERLRLDVHYVDHLNWKLDLLIVRMTIAQVLTGKDIEL